ncbi:Mitochondrial fission protein [Balamuthia mandrillaris]
MMEQQKTGGLSSAACSSAEQEGPFPLLALPSEILCAILAFLPASDLAKLALVSSPLRDLSLDNFVWIAVCQRDFEWIVRKPRVWLWRRRDQPQEYQRLNTLWQHRRAWLDGRPSSSNGDDAAGLAINLEAIRSLFNETITEDKGRRSSQDMPSADMMDVSSPCSSHRENVDGDEDEVSSACSRDARSVHWKEKYKEYCQVEKNWAENRFRFVTTLQRRTDRASVYYVTFSEDLLLCGTELRNGSNTSLIQFRDVNTLRPLPVIIPSTDAHMDDVNCIQFDERTMVTSSDDRTVKEWNISDLGNIRCVSTFYGHQGPVGSAVYNAEHIFSSCDDTYIRQWDREKQVLLATMEGHEDRCKRLRMDGNCLWSTSRDKTLKMWDIRTTKCAATFIGHTTWVTAITLHGDEVVTGSADRTIRVWDKRSTECTRVLNEHQDMVMSLCSSGPRMVSSSGSRDSCIRIWDIKTYTLMHTLRYHSGSVFGLSCSENKIVSSAGYGDETIKLYDFSA